MTMGYAPRHSNPAQDRFRLAFDFPNPGTGGAGAFATGTVTFLANASMTDGDTLIVGDGIKTPVTFEYDKSANGVAGSNTSVAAGTTAASIAALFRTAILAAFPALTVVDNADGSLTITHKIVGTVGNVSMTGTTTHIVVVGMASGVAASMNATLIADATVKLYKVKGRSIELKRGQINVPAGFVHDDTNYVIFKVLKNSTIAMSWSTKLTGGDGSLTADTSAELTQSATPANLRLDDGDLLEFFVDTFGSPTVPAGHMTVEGFEL